MRTDKNQFLDEQSKKPVLDKLSKKLNCHQIILKNMRYAAMPDEYGTLSK